jgi:hypothetical protein
MLISCTEAKAGGGDVPADETTASDGGSGVPDTDMTKPYYGDYFAYDLSEFIRIPSLSDVKVKSEDVDALYKANMAKALTSLNLLNDVASEGITELYDTVNIDFISGVVFVNGQALEETYILSPTHNDFGAEGISYPLTVKKGHVFLMGDNRNDSYDSRYSGIGQVDKRNILGKVFFITSPGKDPNTGDRDLSRFGFTD